MSYNFGLASEQQQLTHNIEPFVIELSPPSSPELFNIYSIGDSLGEIDDLSLDSSQASSVAGSCATSQTSAESLGPAVRNPKPLSPLGGLLNAYTTAKASRHNAHSASDLRQKVINYVHHNVVTITDIKLLIPAHNHDFGLINKLISTIGYHYAARHITKPTKEALLLHILTHGDDRTDVYNRVHARIQHCRTLLQKNPARKLRGLDTQRKTPQREHQQQPRNLASRLLEFPPHLRIPASNPELLPIGATSAAEMYFEVYGMGWDEVRRLDGRAVAPLRGVTEGASRGGPESCFAASVPLGRPGERYARSGLGLHAPLVRACEGVYAQWCTVGERSDHGTSRIEMPADRGTHGAGGGQDAAVGGGVVRVQMPMPGFVVRVDRGKMNFFAVGEWGF